MRRFWIIGNAGSARECYWLYRDMEKGCASLAKDMEFAGFLAWKHYRGDLKGLADLEKGEALEKPINREDRFAIGIGDPHLRHEIYQIMKARGAEFFTLAHPTVEIAETALIGEANIFQRNSLVFCDAKIGNANYANGAVIFSHDVEAGDANFLGPFTLLLGAAHIGSRNMIAVRATVLAHARIGDDNIIAPGSMVYKGCRNGVRLAGNPALNLAYCQTAPVAKAENKQ